MKEIKINISDEVFSELKSEFTIKGITGNFATLTDVFMHKLISAINEKVAEITLEFDKKERKKK